MNLTLRIFLLLFAVLLLWFVVSKLRKEALEIVDSIFWAFLAVLFIVIAAFPGLVYWAAALFGFASPSNFVFFCGIAVVLVRLFTLEIKIVNLKKKMTTLVQTAALWDADRS